MSCSWFVKGLCPAVAAAWLAGCGGMQALGQSGTVAPTNRSSARLPATNEALRLYVGGIKISEYRLGSVHPLRSANPDGTAEAMRTDSLGNLFAISLYGSSARALRIFDARSLKTQPYSGSAGNTIAIDANNYLYLRGYGEITVLTPGAAQKLHVMRKGIKYRPGPMVFDSSGKLYVSNAASIAVFAPTSRPGYMTYARTITKGIQLPVALAVDPSDQLFVANCRRCPFSQPGKRKDWISVYASNGSAPLRRFDDGSDGRKIPRDLAIDSTGRLYVANDNLDRAGGPHGGEILVYAPGGSTPIGTITQGIDIPVALALDPSNNLYVANAYGGDVTVYNPGGTQLLQTIKDGVKFPQALLISAP